MDQRRQTVFPAHSVSLALGVQASTQVSLMNGDLSSLLMQRTQTASTDRRRQFSRLRFAFFRASKLDAREQEQ